MFRLIPFIAVEAVFILVIIIPFILTIYISLLRWRANRPFEQANFSGFLNYGRVLAKDEFWMALGPHVLLRGGGGHPRAPDRLRPRLPPSPAHPGRRLYITIFLAPMMVVPVVVGYNFSMIYVDSGPLNQILAPFLEPLGIDPRIRWLSHPLAAQWAIILADVWQWTSLTFLIFLSGFAALPQQLVDAARVLGASPSQIFWRVQLPLLKPAIIIAVVIRSMEALKMFDPVVLLTFGGPGISTQTIAYYLWQEVWVFSKYSYGAAASILLLIFFSVFIFFGIWLLVRQRESVRRVDVDV